MRHLPLFLVLCFLAGSSDLASAQDDPFGDYHDLLEALGGSGRPSPQPSAEPVAPSPTDHVLTGARLIADATGASVRLEAVVEVDVLRSGWVRIPLGLQGASLIGASVSRPGAWVAPDPAGKPGLVLVARGRGSIQATLQLAVPLTTTSRGARFQLELPSAPLTELSVSLPAGAEDPRVGGALVVSGGAEVVTARFGPGATATVHWTGQVREAVGPGDPKRPDPLLFAETFTGLQLQEGVLIATTRIDYAIHQAPCDTFQVRVPRGYTLLEVGEKALRRYPTTEETAGGQEITVELRTPVRGRYLLELRLQRVLAEGTSEVEFPRIVPLGTARDSGVVAAHSSRYLALEAGESSGLAQVDAGVLTETQQAALGWRPGEGAPPLVYRYHRQPYRLSLRTRAVEARVNGRVHTLVVARDGELGVATTVHYTVRKRGIFGVRLGLPPGYRLLEALEEEGLRDVRTVPGAEGDVLEVDFREEVLPGSFTLTLFGQIPWDGAEFSLPQVALLDVEQQDGVLAVAAEQHLQATLGQRGGLLPLPQNSLVELGYPYAVPEACELFGSFRTNDPADIRGSVTVVPRAPQVHVRSETRAQVQEDRIRVTTSLHYDVVRSRIDRVRLRLPAGLNPTALRFAGEGIKDRRIEPGPEGEPAVLVVVLQGLRHGPFQLEGSYEQPFAGLGTARRQRLGFGGIEPLDCEAVTGALAVERHESLALADVGRERLEPRDPDDLPAGLRRGEVVLGYHVVGHPFVLSLEVTRYDLRTPFGLVVRHLHQEEVLRADGSLQGELLLEVQNRSQQSLSLAMPTGARVRQVIVDGEMVTAGTGEPWEGRPTLQIHLGTVTKARGSEPFPLRVRYAVDGTASLGAFRTHELEAALALPAGVAPLVNVTRRIHLPADYALLVAESPGVELFRAGTALSFLRGFLPRGNAPISRGASGLVAARSAIRELEGRAEQGSVRSLYEPLEVPGRSETRLFARSGGPVPVRVQTLGWTAFVFFDVLFLVLVAAGGLLSARRWPARAAVLPLVALGVTSLGWFALSAAWQPFLVAIGVAGAGLLGFQGAQALWRELALRRLERRQEVATQEAVAARARAQAAEAEAKIPSPAPSPTQGGRS